MEDQNLYDEFGNYIGPQLEEEEENDMIQELQSDEDENLDGQQFQDGQQQQKQEDGQKAPFEHKIVLHEDKQYYPEMQELYPGVDIRVEEEDTQDINQPIIQIVKDKKFDLVEKEIPQTSFSQEFLQQMMNKPELIRNVSIVGHLHHGKSLFTDMFVQQAHIDKKWDLNLEYKYTDSRLDEQERKISIKSSPLSLILPDLKEKSHLINLFDTPGHPDFQDEVCCSLRASDGALLLVDVIEGVTYQTDKQIRYLVQEQIAITVVISKIDRIVLELKLPPSDAYLKIKHILEEINGIIAQASYHLPDEERKKLKVSPLLGNVAFASGTCGFAFTLKSFAKKYAEAHPKIDQDFFQKVLWGDYYYNANERKFINKPTKEFDKRTFVQFILEPLYKIMAYTISYDRKDLEGILVSLGIFIKKNEYSMDTRPLLKLVCTRFFGDTSSIVDMLVHHVPNSIQGSKLKMKLTYGGKKDTDLFLRLSKCDSNEPLLINIVKLYNKPDCLTFDVFGRVLSGTIHKNETVKVLGQNYTQEDEEDMAITSIKNLYVFESRYRIPVQKVPAGNWVLIEGIDQSISKTATITSKGHSEAIEIFKPIKFSTVSVVKVACEPLIPSELPKMLEGIRKINKSYPLLVTKVEESGEHILIGTGELYMDQVLHDLRQMYSEIEVKISDPCVTFCETVIDTSSIKCFGITPNKKNKITMLAQPLDKGLSDDIERENIDLTWDKNSISNFFQTNYQWDILASKSIWAFGPDHIGPNILLDDTLPSETNKALLYSVKEPLVQGFQWCTREGPLCEEPIRNVKFKIIEASIAEENIFRGGGQIIPTSRRVCYSSFLMATPRLMEPMFITEIQCTADCLNALFTVLQRRRGHIISELAIPGSPLYQVKAKIPAIDSFGFEVDLRVHTSGQAHCLTTFDSWSLLPGDPLDKTIQLKPLEPSPPPHLAREFLIKTRRRKGLNEDVSIIKFFDDPNLIELLKTRDDYKIYL